MDESVAKRYKELCEALKLHAIPSGEFFIKERLSSWALWAARTGHDLENIGLAEYVHWLSDKGMPSLTIDEHIKTLVDVACEARKRPPRDTKPLES